MNLSACQRYGLEGEQWAARQLSDMGYHARLLSLWTADFDILIDNLLCCEVKISRSRLRRVRPGYYRPTWSFDLARLPRHMDMVVILICEDDYQTWWPYVVPSWYFFGRNSVNITSHPQKYRGYLAGCLHNWSNVGLVMAQRQKYSYQLPLPLFQGV
jgi:hypothetical protein